jgi:steroid 5-alpha reductase family enzyme
MPVSSPFWGLSFVIAGWIYFARTFGGDEARKNLLIILVSLWGLHLSLFLLWRNWGRGDDFLAYPGFWRCFAGEITQQG